jgi:AcrR family transcriptional regulator
MADELAAAVRAYEEARAAVADAENEADRIVTKAKDQVVKARSRLAEAIVAAARAGVRQVDIVRVTGYTRERVRQICRAAGIEPPSDNT